MNTSLQLDYSTSDRFIPLRRSSSDSFNISSTYPRPLNVSCEDYCKNPRLNDSGSGSGSNYLQLLSKTNCYNNLLIEKIFKNPRRVLYFSPKQKKLKTQIIDVLENSEECWPVKSRKKPLLTTPELILDMPNIQTITDECNQRIDWGASGFIATIHENLIHTNNPDTAQRFVIETGKTLEDCIKWNENGDRLAVSFQDRTISIWDFRVEKVVATTSLLGKTCCILYTSRLLIAGDNEGRITMWNHDLILKKIINAHNGSILALKISCNERYLVSSGKDGYIKMWCMSRYEEFYQIHYNYGLVKSIDWHPWKESLLVIGLPIEKSFCSLWNVNKPSNMMVEKHFNDPIVDCITFNPISAEVVISFWISRPGEIRYGQNVVVLSSLERIVDDMNFHPTRTPYLLWDKTGTRLASIGADENLAIWNFFGDHKKSKVRTNLFQAGQDILKSGTIR